MKKIIALTFCLLVSFLIFSLAVNPVFAITPASIPGTYSLGTDGSTSYFYNSSIIPNTSGDASFDFWFYWKNAGNYASRKSFFTTGFADTDSPSYLFWVDPDGHLGMYDNAGHDCAENLSHAWTQNTWYHIYWGRNATTGTCYFGVNGIVTTSSSSPGNYSGQFTGLWWGTGYYGKINGAFDEIRVSNIVRWTNNFPLPTAEYTTDANTVALWHMNEGSGATSADDSGNGYTLTFSGATWDPGYFSGSPIPSPTPFPTPVPGTYGLGTDGSPLSYIYNTTIVPNRVGDASFDFWFYWKNAGNYDSRESFFTTGSPGNDSPSYLFYVESDGHLGMYDNAGHNCVENLTRNWTQNTWHHVYWGRNALTGMCYFGVNGTVTTTLSSTGNYDGQATGLWWGTGIYGRVNGTFDEIRVSDIVRWTSDFSVPTSEYTTDTHTIALWHTDEGSGTTSADDSGNGYTLALSNATWDPGYFGPSSTPVQLSALSPVKVWVGLKNSDDVGIKFDFLAEVYKDGTLVGSGQLNGAPGGGSGFNNAKLNIIPLNLFTAVNWPLGSSLKIKLYVRNTCSGNTHNSGTARLWYNDNIANSQFGATIDSVTSNYFLLNSFILDTAPGSGPKKTIDVAAGSPCSLFKSFGIWSKAP